MYNAFGLRDQDYSNMIIEGIKFIVVITDERYIQVIDMGGLKLQRATGTDIHLWKQA